MVPEFWFLQYYITNLSRRPIWDNRRRFHPTSVGSGFTQGREKVLNLSTGHKNAFNSNWPLKNLNIPKVLRELPEKQCFSEILKKPLDNECSISSCIPVYIKNQLLKFDTHSKTKAENSETWLILRYLMFNYSSVDHNHSFGHQWVITKHRKWAPESDMDCERALNIPEIWSLQPCANPDDGIWDEYRNSDPLAFLMLLPNLGSCWYWKLWV